MSNLHRGGLPVGMEVTRLQIALGIPTTEVIPYSKIEEVLGINRKSVRFISICREWRARVYTENGLKLVAVRGMGFRALSASERPKHHLEDFIRGAKTMVKAARSASEQKFDSIPADERPAAIRQAERMARISRASEEDARELKALPELPLDESEKKARGNAKHGK